MKIKILPIFLTIIFLIIFLIFYKGLQNPNIYTPKNVIQKDIPFFKVKIFDTNNQINSKEIFKSNKFYLMNIWASWCVPCREEHPFLINLSNQKIIFGNKEIKFDVDTFKKKCLIEGLDDIALSLEKSEKIISFENKIKSTKPWIFND